MVLQTEHIAKLFFLKRTLFVNFVSEDHEWHILELWHLQQTIKLSLGLVETSLVSGVNHEDDAINGTAIL